MSGKGDRPRPIVVGREEFNKKHDKIKFKPRCGKCFKHLDKCICKSSNN